MYFLTFVVVARRWRSAGRAGAVWEPGHGRRQDDCRVQRSAGWNNLQTGTVLMFTTVAEPDP
jgi:hypothetical protein